MLINHVPFSLIKEQISCWFIGEKLPGILKCLNSYVSSRKLSFCMSVSYHQKLGNIVRRSLTSQKWIFCELAANLGIMQKWDNFVIFSFLFKNHWRTQNALRLLHLMLLQFLITSSYLIFQFKKFISECSILDRWVTLYIKNSRQNREGKMPLSYTVFACVGCRTICKQSKWLIYLDCWNTKNLSLSCSVIISPSFFFCSFLRGPSMLIICIPKKKKTKTQKQKTNKPTPRSVSKCTDVWHQGLKESL